MGRVKSLVVAAVLLAACNGSPTVSTTTTSSVTTTSRAEAVTGTIGVPITFAGLQIRVGEPVDPANPAEAMVSPDPGFRYVRIPVTAQNPTSRHLSFTPVSQAKLFDGSGERYSARPGLYPGDLAGTEVAPEATVEGSVSFSVPSGAALARVVFTDLQGVTTTVELGN